MGTVEGEGTISWVVVVLGFNRAADGLLPLHEEIYERIAWSE